MARAQVRAGDSDRAGGREIVERRRLARSQATRSEAGRPRARRGRGVGEAGDADVSRPGAGLHQRPVEVDPVRRAEGAEAPEERGTAFGRRQSTDRSRAVVEECEERTVFGIDSAAVAVRRRAIRPSLGDQLEPLQEARREHRPEDERGRSEVVVARSTPPGASRAGAGGARRRGRGPRSAWWRDPGQRHPGPGRFRVPGVDRTRRRRPLRARSAPVGPARRR